MKKFLTILLVLVAMVAQAQTLNYKGKFTLNVELDGAEKQFACYNIYLSDKYFHTPKQATTSVPVKDGKFTYEVEVDYMKGLCLKGVDAQGKEQAGPGVEVYAVPNVTYDVKIAGGQLTPTKSQSDQYPWLSKVERYSWDARRATKWTSPYLPKPAGTRWSEVEQRCDTFYRMSVKEVWLGQKETVVRLMSEACDARRGAGKDDYLLDENGKQYKMVRTLLGNPGEDNSAEVGVYGGYYAFEPLPQTVKSFTYVSGTCKVSEVRKAGKKPVKEPAPNFKVTIHPTNGIFDTGYLLYMYDRLEKPNNQLGILKDVPCDENLEVYFETYIEEPTEFYMVATFADGSICPTGVKIPAFPGHAIVNVMDGTYELTGDEGFYKEMQDAIDFVENTWGSDKDSGEKNKKIRRYLLNHANEQGTLYAYYYRYLLSIDQMYDVLNDKQLDTPIGRLIMERYKDYEWQMKKAKEIARNSSKSTNTASTSTSSYQRRRADNYKPDLDLLRSQAPAGNSVDLGLSVMWADMNVGAKTSSEAGQAYNWGDVEVPPFRNQSWLYYKWCKGSNKDLTKYCTLSEYGQTDNLSTLLPEDDAAAALWQGEWRIPTKEEWDELVTKCTWTETIESGVKGYKVTGPNGHSIFLPYAGCLNWQGVYGKGEHAYYWSSSIDPKNPSFAYYMHADTNKQEVGAMDRFAGRFIRPVRTAIQANKKEKVGKTVKGAVEYTVNGVKFNMIKVEGGIFEMGSKPKNIQADDDEYPRHKVTLSDYMIGESEVTQELWEAVMGSNPSGRCGLQLPVENVSWEECQTFIRKLKELTGANFCLPTEAEWEYAVQGGTKSKGYKYSGSDDMTEVAWCYRNSDGVSHPVKTRKCNELGIYDMTGNVYEWCNDYYAPYSDEEVTNPTGPAAGGRHVYRGGTHGSDVKGCNLTDRCYFDLNRRSPSIGLRLAVSSR